MKIMEFLNHPLLQALGISLIHSLWQGLLLLILLVFILLFIPRSNPRVRYWLSVVSLLTLFAASIFTLFSVYRPAPVTVPLELILTASFHQPSGTMPQAGIFDRIDYWINLINPYLTITWLLGILFLTIRMCGSYYYVHRIRSKSYPASQEFNQILHQVQKRFRTQRKIGLFFSTRIEVPMVIGFLKPVILWPAGMVTGLNTEQIEMILAHEIAHIRRYDYLVNMFETLLENIYFFNPSVWLISQLIREEREACCDYTAISKPENALIYIKALASIEHFRQDKLTAAMALNGHNHLLKRIKRIAEPERPKFADKLIVMSLLVISTFFLGYTRSFEPVESTESTKSNPFTSDILPDSLPEPSAPITELQPVVPPEQVQPQFSPENPGPIPEVKPAPSRGPKPVVAPPDSLDQEKFEKLGKELEALFQKHHFKMEEFHSMFEELQAFPELDELIKNMPKVDLEEFASRHQFNFALDSLHELNFEKFELNQEKQEKIRQMMENWERDHQDEIKKLQEEMEKVARKWEESMQKQEQILREKFQQHEDSLMKRQQQIELKLKRLQKEKETGRTDSQLRLKYSTGNNVVSVTGEKQNISQVITGEADTIRINLKHPEISQLVIYSNNSRPKVEIHPRHE